MIRRFVADDGADIYVLVLLPFNREDARIWHDSNAPDYGTGVFLRLLHGSGQLAHRSEDQSTSDIDYVAATGRHCWQCHGHQLPLDSSTLYRHVPDVRRFVLSIQRCPSLGSKHYSKDADKARNCICSGEHVR